MIRLALLALIVFGGLWLPGETRAAADCPNNGTCDQGTAYAMCKAAIERTKQKFDVPGNPWGKPNVRQDCTPGGTAAKGSFTCAVAEGPNGGAVRCYNAAGDDNTQQFYYTGACSARPEETSWKGGGNNGLESVCSNGCAYSGSLYAQAPTGRLFTPTGATCTENDHPAPTTPDPGEGGGDGGGTGPGEGGGDGGG
ncbi:hypothetical protein I3V73_04005, partial [Stenotrophomonas sp. 232]|nr:hypothetical protein [Stenotrophomonas sp. 232]